MKRWAIVPLLLFSFVSLSQTTQPAPPKPAAPIGPDAKPSLSRAVFPWFYLGACGDPDVRAQFTASAMAAADGLVPGVVVRADHCRDCWQWLATWHALHPQVQIIPCLALEGWLWNGNVRTYVANEDGYTAAADALRTWEVLRDCHQIMLDWEGVWYAARLNTPDGRAALDWGTWAAALAKTLPRDREYLWYPGYHEPHWLALAEQGLPGIVRLVDWDGSLTADPNLTLSRPPWRLLYGGMASDLRPPGLMAALARERGPVVGLYLYPHEQATYLRAVCQLAGPWSTAIATAPAGGPKLTSYPAGENSTRAAPLPAPALARQVDPLLADARRRSMVELKITQCFFDGQAVTSAVDQAKRRVLSRAGAYVMRVARNLIRTGKGRAGAGQPPHSHTGTLKRLLFFSWDTGSASVVIGPTPVGSGTAPHALEVGGTSRIVTRRRGRRVIVTAPISEHPYMAPALQRSAPKLPAEWAGAVKG